MPKHEHLTKRKKILWKRGEIAPKEQFHNSFNVSLTSRDQLHIYLLNVVVRIFFHNSANLICRGTDISKYLIKSLGIRDNENRLYTDYMKRTTVNPRYNTIIGSQGCRHENEFAVLKNF